MNDLVSMNRQIGKLLQTRSLKVGQFTLASGRSSHYYVDGRKVTLSADGARLIGEQMLRQIESLDSVAAIGGLTMGADPIVGAPLAAAGLTRPELVGFLVRKAPKQHGTNQLVEGPVQAGMDVVVVEDVTTTGASALQAVDAVEAIGCRVVQVITVLDRLEGAGEAFERRQIPFHALVTIRDLGVEPLA